METQMQSIGPVSYTHLDVYKRQGGEFENVAILVAIAVNEDGYLSLIHI